MTDQPPRLTDPSALRAHRARARRMGVEDWLQTHVVHDIADRLRAVNRVFSRPAIIGPRAALWREILMSEGVLTGADVLEDTPVLPLEGGAHDLVIHAFALHWADDPVGQLIQMRRALCPDGLLLAAAPGGATLAELRAALAEAEIALRGGLSPRVAPMAEVRDLGSLLQRAGLALPVADAETLTVTYPSLSALFKELRAMGETNALANRDRRIPPRALFERAGEIYAETARAPDENGRIRATVEILTLTGWAPSETQQKPLRPGSAQRRLADALGVAEQAAGEKPPILGPGDPTQSRDN